MADKTYVLGHQNPDTDSILSSLAWAKYLQDQGQDAEAIKLGDINNETKYILDKFDLKQPTTKKTLNPGCKIFLVDHNSKGQSIANREELEVSGLIDHHSIGDFVTDGPLYARLEPIGSTCSILYKIFEENDYDIDSQMASILLSAILSDTLLFNSPTTTPQDKDIVAKLAEISNIDYEKHAMEMFSAKSDLSEMNAKEIVRSDYKTYNMSNHRVGIGVLETTDPSYAIDRKLEIFEAMKEIKAEDNLYIIVFSVIDIINKTNKTFVLSDKEKDVIREVFELEADTMRLVDMGQRVSRKRQIVPDLRHYFANL